jgi:hypothetical protein
MRLFIFSCARHVIDSGLVQSQPTQTNRPDQNSAGAPSQQQHEKKQMARVMAMKRKIDGANR